MTDPDDPTARPTDGAESAESAESAEAPADPPQHAGPDDEADPAFDIDLEPEEQGTAAAGAEPTD